MRKLIFQEWLTMEGFAADAAGNVNFLESTTLNKYSDQDQLEWMESIDTILLGANTYKSFVDFWPGATTDMKVIADKINSLPKVVFSKSLTKALWGKWP